MTATAHPPTRPGVRYRATRNSDGTFNVHGVEVFGTLPAGERGNATEIGREWMLAAIEGAAVEEKRGFLAPLKPTHASGMARASGYIRPTHVARDTYEGAEIDVLYADFIAIPAGEFEAIKRGEWPYRSVEVRSWDVPRINAVALLAADPPFFRFPMIAGVLLDESQPGVFAAMKFAAFGDGEEGGGKSAPPESAEHEKREASTLEEIKTMLSRLVAGMASLLKGDKAEKTDESLEAVAQPVEDVPPDAGDESDVDADETAEVAAEASADDGSTDDSGGDEKMPNDKKKEGANMSADPAVTLAALTAKMDGLTASLAAMTAERDGLAAKLAAEEAKTKAAETAAACAKAIAEARAKLRAKRRILPADFDARAAKFYAAGTFEEFVATAEACFASDPEEHFGGGAMVAATGDAEIDAAVAKFASGKPAGTFELATEAAEKFRAMKRNAPKSTVTIDEYLRVNVRPASPAAK